jgi:hypothetical protein
MGEKMSADNGIYILRMKDQCRVGHFQNIENLCWSNLDLMEVSNFVPTRILEYYIGLSPMTLDAAQKMAFQLEEEIPICEYGIVTIRVDKTWNEILDDAKELIVKEIDFLENDPSVKSFWKDEIKRLKLLRDVLFGDLFISDYLKLRCE